MPVHIELLFLLFGFLLITNALIINRSPNGHVLNVRNKKKLVMNPVPDYIPFLFFSLFSVDDRAIMQRILLEHLLAAF